MKEWQAILGALSAFVFAVLGIKSRAACALTLSYTPSPLSGFKSQNAGDTAQ
jgi:hypothetical protein